MTNLIEVKNIVKTFKVGKWPFRALQDVSFSIAQGETMGLVGESGCGKSTLARAILYLDPPNSGEVFFGNEKLSTLSRRKMKAQRQKMQMIFQDPYASLDPRMTVRDIIAEALHIHKIGTPSQRNRRVEELLTLIGLPLNAQGRFPHEFSGGQRQRIGIARALAPNPAFIVFDEPLSALDVSVQAQIVNLFKELQKKMGVTSLFIAHDLAMIKYLCDKVAVLYRGQLMELAPTDILYATPLHPYTRALINAIPQPNPQKERSRLVLQGELPSPLAHTSGCPFQNRCPLANSLCQEKRPTWREVAPGHFVACHYVEGSSSTTS